jgi:hypothetical protein
MTEIKAKENETYACIARQFPFHTIDGYIKDLRLERQTNQILRQNNAGLFVCLFFKYGGISMLSRK